ncbi:unnamed protein product [Chrysodeixis includens]|uniref:Uncharacterized protein n=1 Tax=Chrysodeixis includens TaxID=689277 RepID=A0A9P0FX57_CHRIL|nr:unnamed protein product [Chrysodeixis includens]
MLPFYMPYPSYVFSFGTNLPSIFIPTTTVACTSTTTRPCTSALRTKGLPQNIPFGFPMGIPMGIPGPPIAMPAVPPMGYPMGAPLPPPMGYPMGAPPPPLMGYHMGVPPGVPNYPQPPNNFPNPNIPKPTQNNEESYDDNDDDGKWLYIYNDNRDRDEDDTERKQKDKNRKDRISFNTDYEDKHNTNNKIKWNSLFWNKKPEKFVQEVIEDLDAQGDTFGHGFDPHPGQMFV